MKCANKWCLETHPDPNFKLPSGIKNWVCSDECLFFLHDSFQVETIEDSSLPVPNILRT